MKKAIIFFILACFFSTAIIPWASADGISDLKNELKAMRKEINLQAKQIGEQQKLISAMQSKIDELGTTTEATKEAVKSVEKEIVTVERSEIPIHQDRFIVTWSDGLRYTTVDKNFDLKAGFRIQADFGWMREDAKVKDLLGDLDSPAEFRRVRTYISGTVHENAVYKIQLDFAGGDVGFRDVYLGLKNVPYLDLVRVGQFTAPFSLEDMTSSNHITFLERSLPYALSIHRRTGIGFDANPFDERVAIQASVFYNSDDDTALPENNAANFAARLTGLPWYEEDGAKLLHLGAAYCFRNSEDKNKRTFSYSSRPEAHLVPNFVDTGDFDGNFANLLGLESVLIYGPFSVQSELIQSFVDLKTGNTGYFKGFYAYASYFLTGEHRNYNKFWGTFSAIDVKRNFSFRDWSPGAWEVAARYSYLDFCTQDINGGVLQDLTLGLNWYLNSNMKVMFNYIHAHPSGVGDADIIEVRCQIDY